jgi:hypothetical protein
MIALPPFNRHASCGFSPPDADEHRRNGASAGGRNHQIPASPAHQARPQDDEVATPLGLYTIRIKGRLGTTALSAFPTMEAELTGGETVLTGVLEDRSAVFGVLLQIEALGLELIELRQVSARAPSPETGDCPAPDGV